MAGIVGKMVRGYFVAPDTGICYKVHKINMGDYSNDMTKIRDEVNRVNGLIQMDAENSLAVIGLLQTVWEKAKNDLPKITEEIGSKSLPFIYLPKEVAKPEDTPLPFGFFEKCFVWNGRDSNVWSAFDSNGLGHRFAFVHTEDEIPAGPVVPPVVVPPVVVPPVVVPPVAASSAKLECLKMSVDLAEMAENTPSAAEIVARAKEFNDFIKAG